jgi:transcriptional regulator with XRE-family HTH domain
MPASTKEEASMDRAGISETPLNEQAHAQLWQWLKDQGITQEEAARATGYTVNYLSSVLRGAVPLTGNVIIRIANVYPETSRFLLPDRVVKSLVSTVESCGW